MGHWAIECAAMQDLRGEAEAALAGEPLTEEWLLQGGDADLVRTKVRLLGRAMGRLVANLRAAWEHRRAAAKQGEQGARKEEQEGSPSAKRPRGPN